MNEFLFGCMRLAAHTPPPISPQRNCSKKYTQNKRGRENGDWRTRIRPIRNGYGYDIHLNLWNVFEPRTREGRKAFYAAAQRKKTKKQQQITLVAPTCKLSHVKCALIRVIYQLARVEYFFLHDIVAQIRSFQYKYLYLNICS